MKKMYSALVLSGLLSMSVSAHSPAGGHGAVRHWVVPGAHRTLDGAFLMYKDDQVYVEAPDHQVSHYALTDFSSADQAFVLQKQASIAHLNAYFGASQTALVPAPAPASWPLQLLLLALVVGAGSWYLVAVADQARRRYLRPIGLVLGLLLVFGFTKKAVRALQSTTDPLVVNAAFAPFRAQVSTYWTSTYFYVQSRGIPSHPMMTGITNWQQQVPVPQCYVGTNAWPIPLNPVVAAVPVPVNASHFTRGAIAVAVNGVVIFNPYTNTGVDALLDGQLDVFGGHCGMADDYHYHVAPLSLYLNGQTVATLPIAYGLDGFAVFGPTEPDGVSMTALDANHGHYYGPAGVYHYHGTPTAPYMIGSMVGQVTEDATNQIIPQAAAQPVRPGQQPLRGATITGCVANATGTGYTLTYTLNGQVYSLNYSWTSAGLYTFNLVAPTGTTTNNYPGTAPCVVPLLATRAANAPDNLAISLYPNPGGPAFSLTLGPGLAAHDVREIGVYDLKGALRYRINHFQTTLDPGPLAPGVYLVKIQTATTTWTNKLLVQ